MSVGWACFRNYVAHAEEIGGETTDYPRFFIMPESSHVFSDNNGKNVIKLMDCLLYTSPSPRDKRQARMPSSA